MEVNVKQGKMRALLVMQFLTLLLVIGLIGYAIFFFANRQHIPESVERMKEQIKTLELKQLTNDEIISKFGNSLNIINDEIDKLKEYTPKDGVNGINGTPGKDSLSTHTVETETIIEKETILKEVPVNGKDGYIDIRCNESKNRWEVRYSLDDVFKVLNGTPTKCAVL